MLPWGLFPRKQFPSSFSILEQTFQIVAVYIFDNVISRAIHRAQIAVVFLQGKKNANIRKQAYSLLYSTWLSSLAFSSP